MCSLDVTLDDVAEQSWLCYRDMLGTIFCFLSVDIVLGADCYLPWKTCIRWCRRSMFPYSAVSVG